MFVIYFNNQLIGVCGDIDKVNLNQLVQTIEWRDSGRSPLNFSTRNTGITRKFYNNDPEHSANVCIGYTLEIKYSDDSYDVKEKLLQIKLIKTLEF